LGWFKEIDRDGDGVIEKSEILAVFSNHGIKVETLIDIDSLIQRIDTNGSGQIDFTEFLVAASKEEELLQRQRLESAFAYLDTDHNGYITADEIRPFLDTSDQTA
jgi:calcium-dependent protein kinase